MRHGTPQSAQAVSPETKKPLIGVLMSHAGSLMEDPAAQGLTQSVQRGIEALSGGVVSILFEGVRAGIDGPAAHYRLPRRDLLADEVECAALSAGMEGLVVIGSSSEGLAGLLMGAVRTSLPAIAVNLGKGAGGCPAFRFALAMEAMGVSMPGMASMEEGSPERFELAYQVGRRAVEMVRQGQGLKKIITGNALSNAVLLDAALGGTAETTLHLLAIAQECGVKLSYGAIGRIHQETPQLVDLKVSKAEGFAKAGGVFAVLSALKGRVLPGMTVSGKNIADLVRAASPRDPKVIHIKKPLRKSSGLAILSGNLASDGAIVDVGALPEARQAVSGSVRVFDSEESCTAAVRNHRIKKGMILVVRYEGPAGGPGMRPLRSLQAVLEEMGLAETVPVITDGRLAGFPKGLFVGMVSPEAAAGGPIALLKDGDLVEINVPQRQLIARLTDTDLKVRMARWKTPAPKASGGYLSRYSRLVTGAHLGAVVKS